METHETNPEEVGQTFVHHLHGLQRNELSTDAVFRLVDNTICAFTNLGSSLVSFHAAKIAGKETGRRKCTKGSKGKG